jgi:sulfur-oxidizing protein SoxZ
MPPRTRIRIRRKPQGIDIMVLMLHPMETGLREDSRGRTIPAHFITDARVTMDGRLVLEAGLSIAISKDPLLTFRLGAAQAGSKLTVLWRDNRGDTEEVTAIVPAA